jgi:hypothetical protein
MNNRGSGMLIVVLVALALLIVGAFFLVGPVPSGSAPPGGPGVPGAASPSLTVSLARTPTGVTATVTVTNSRSEDLKNLRISKATLSPVIAAVPQASLSGTTPLPLQVGRLSRGAATSFTLVFTGPAPAAKAPMQLDITCDYEYGWAGKGSIGKSMTSILP